MQNFWQGTENEFGKKIGTLPVISHHRPKASWSSALQPPAWNTVALSSLLGYRSSEEAETKLKCK